MPLRPPFPEPIELTRREREVAGYLGEDLNYADLAARMGVTTETVRLHAKNLFRKLGVSSRHAAVDELWRRGIVSATGQPPKPTRPGNGPERDASAEMVSETCGS
jgi:DNA-binding CsgD family transcriptional regulator